MKFIVFFAFFVQFHTESFSFNETYLTKYLDYEQSFINDLENFIENQENVLQLLRKKLLNFKVEHTDALTNPRTHFSNKINKFLLVKRLTTDIDLMIEKTFNSALNFHHKIDTMRNEKEFPTRDDVLTSAISIAIQQQKQKFKTEKLAKGIVGKVKSRNNLSTFDCFLIGKQLNFGEFYALASEWLSEALKRFDDYYDQYEVNAIDILEELAKSFMGSNQIEEAEKVVEKVLRMNAKSDVGKMLELRMKSTKAVPFHTTHDIELNTNIIQVETQRFCQPRHFLLHNIFSCSI